MASAAGSFARLLLVFEAKCQAGKIWIQGVVLGDFLKRNPRGGWEIIRQAKQKRLVAGEERLEVMRQNSEREA